MADEEDDPITPLSHAIGVMESAREDFDMALEKAGLRDGHEYFGIRWDMYDNSVEFDSVDNDVRLTEAQQRIIYDNKFSIAFVNHRDGWETHYNWDYREPFKISRGWRRRWVVDPAAKTTNVVGGADKPGDCGYYEISYWPEGWKGQEGWIESGYMRVVPDPLTTPPLESQE